MLVVLLIILSRFSNLDLVLCVERLELRFDNKFLFLMDKVFWCGFLGIGFY